MKLKALIISTRSCWLPNGLAQRLEISQWLLVKRILSYQEKPEAMQLMSGTFVTFIILFIINSALRINKNLDTFLLLISPNSREKKLNNHS